VALLAIAVHAEAGSVRVRCEKRTSPARSKISVDGFDLAAGNYRARVKSGTNRAVAASKATVGDEVEFDFDSNPADVADGATKISPTFIQGDPPKVNGQLVDEEGNVVAASTVRCQVR
jgi:hypothetical protein